MMRQTVEQIVRDIPSGKVFDSHYVIDTLIKNHSDVYLSFAAQKFPEGHVDTPNLHSQIARIIRGLKGELVTQPGLQSCSYTIHETASECELWKRM